jgi:hypothetical protein
VEGVFGNGARLQRATKSAYHSSCGCSDDVIDGGRVRFAQCRGIDLVMLGNCPVYAERDLLTGASEWPRSLTSREVASRKGPAEPSRLRFTERRPRRGNCTFVGSISTFVPAFSQDYHSVPGNTKVRTNECPKRQIHRMG